MSRFRRPQPPKILYIVLPITILVLYLPLFVMVINSFFAPLMTGMPWQFTFHWYEEVFVDPILLGSLKHSFIIAGISAVLSTILGVATALAVSKWNFFIKKPLKGLSMLSLMLPELVLALSLLSWFAVLGLSLSLTTVVIAHITLTLPFASLTVGARLKTLEASLEDAARDLGATEGQILWKVIIPILKDSILTAFLLCFLLSFDDFLVTFYTNGVGSDTLPIKLYSLMKIGLTPRVQALSTLMLICSVVLILCLGRFRKVIED